MGRQNGTNTSAAVIALPLASVLSCSIHTVGTRLPLASFGKSLSGAANAATRSLVAGAISFRPLLCERNTNWIEPMSRNKVFWSLVLIGSHAVAFLGGLRLIPMLKSAPAVAEEAEEEDPLKAAVLAGEQDKFKNFASMLAIDSDAIGWAAVAVSDEWQPGSAAMVLETMRFGKHPGTRSGGFELLKRRMGVQHGRDLNAWFDEVWSRPYEPHPDYMEFKNWLYGRFVEPSFAEYFPAGGTAKIRLDEVRWGGVKRDGIPPLESPKLIAADDADYLADTDVVFGVQVGDEAKAYPKRILAWHEMVKDEVGGKKIAGVYCTLCGTMIAYDSTVDGTNHELGTSGLLYRSNKLMYNYATKSLWSTIDGRPVVGALADQDIKLDVLPVVTSTWGQWKQEHPETKVLSLDTGYQRDYGEGVAYRNYFANDELMFSVPKLDDRLNNKDEVFIVRLDAGNETVAIETGFLASNPVHHDQLGETKFVVVTDSAGACRAFDCGDLKFKQLDEAGVLIDEADQKWKVTESELSEVDGERKFQRFPAHRSFWFAWFSQHPDTRLVQ